MQCPGQDSRYWSGEDVFEVNCPNCGHSVEFFKDDSRRKCRRCGHRLLNPRMDFGCASYCPHAEQCLGSMPPDLLADRGDLFKDRIALAMRKYFGENERRLRQILEVAEQAEAIGSQLEQADMMVVMAAAHLHDEDPSVARKILGELKAEPPLIDEVCDIIRHHHAPREQESVNFKVLSDAVLIVDLIKQYRKTALSQKRLDTILDASFLTTAGAEQAAESLQKLIR